MQGQHDELLLCLDVLLLCLRPAVVALRPAGGNLQCASSLSMAMAAATAAFPRQPSLSRLGSVPGPLSRQASAQQGREGEAVADVLAVADAVAMLESPELLQFLPYLVLLLGSGGDVGSGSAAGNVLLVHRAACITSRLCSSQQHHICEVCVWGGGAGHRLQGSQAA